LSNERGTAPGFWGEVDETLYIALPGPPGELKAMCDRYLDELLGERFDLRVKEFTAATSFLVPESVLEDACRRHAQPGILWRTRVEPFRIHLYVDGGNERQREAFLEALRGDLGSELLRSGEQEPAALFLEAAAGRGVRAAVAESCTGGMLGERITAVPGSSEVFWGSAVVYADEAKRSMLGVSPETLETYGAVSRETAEEMVRGLLERSGVELAASVTGIAGPGGGSAAKPVGTVWIAAGSKGGGMTAYRFAFGQRRALVRRRSVTAALLMMEMELKGELRVDRLEAWHYS
jgi:nicotinamide-nucleotide amidase